MKPEHYRTKRTKACITCGFFAFGRKSFKGWGCSKYDFTISMSLADSALSICDKYEVTAYLKQPSKEDYCEDEDDYS